MAGMAELPHSRLWGTARGVARTLLPEVRVLVALAGLTACLLADAASWPGLVLIGLTVLTAFVAVAPPPKPLGSVLLIGTVLLAPFFVLAPWSAAALPRNGLPWIGGLVAPWRIVFTGLGVLAVVSTGVSSLTRSDLREALARLPLPRLLAAVILQIVMQTDLLVQEAARIMLALRGRGATHGLGNRLRVVLGLPRVWLPRLVFKAERVALAMEARGYPTRPLSLVTHHRRTRDGVALVAAVAWAALAALVRMEYVP